mgnify:CR=1 FL=1
MKPADITPQKILLTRKFRSISKAAVATDMKPHRLRRICNGQQRPTEQEREIIISALGEDPFDPGSRFKDQDRAAHARLIDWSKGMGGLAHVRQQRLMLFGPNELN